MKINEKKVEAVLFAVGKEISSERIASLCSLEVKDVEKIMKKLSTNYDQQENSLQIAKKDNGWKLTVLDEFVPLVSNLVSSTELEKPLMETLAVVAWRYPIVQSEIIKLRGAGAYDHMRSLVEQGFIVKERFGRTYQVKLTKKIKKKYMNSSARKIKNRLTISKWKKKGVVSYDGSLPETNLKAALILPDGQLDSPTFLVFENYEKILKWNRSLRFGISVCTLANMIKI